MKRKMATQMLPILGAALLFVPNVFASPAELTLGELDQITAGSADRVLSNASGGAIVGNDSSATIHFTGSVELTDGAQLNADALNLVNSSESTVANGVNIWNAAIDANVAVSDGVDFNVEQSNNVAQEQRRVASLPYYDRPDKTIVEDWDNNGSSRSQTSRLEDDSVTDTLSSSSTHNTTSKGNVDTKSEIVGQEIKGGRGVAGSGELDVHFDAGDFSVEVGAGIGAGILDASVKVTLGLPELDVNFTGSGCAVMGGNCNSEGTTTNITNDETNNSTHHLLDTKEDSASEFSEKGSRNIRSPFSLESAQAEYIIVDNSQLDVASVYTVSLSGTAQQDLKALNVVNAAGSAVANGVNIARTGNATTGNGLLNLTQSNVIVHSR